jgi:hypothetical protein
LDLASRTEAGNIRGIEELVGRDLGMVPKTGIIIGQDQTSGIMVGVLKDLRDGTILADNNLLTGTFQDNLDRHLEEEEVNGEVSRIQEFHHGAINHTGDRVGIEEEYHPGKAQEHQDQGCYQDGRKYRPGKALCLERQDL